MSSSRGALLADECHGVVGEVHDGEAQVPLEGCAGPALGEAGGAGARGPVPPGAAQLGGAVGGGGRRDVVRGGESVAAGGLEGVVREGTAEATDGEKVVGARWTNEEGGVGDGVDGPLRHGGERDDQVELVRLREGADGVQPLPVFP